MQIPHDFFEFRCCVLPTIWRNSFQMKYKLTRSKASKIATDLVEGGIGDTSLTKLLAEAHGVNVDQVRAIRRCVRRMGDEMACSMVEAIENGWEDSTLNLVA